MKRFVLLALTLAAVLAPSASAVTGSVSVTSSATNAVCNGVSTVSVTLQTAAPPPASAPLDLVIAIDESGSLNATDFKHEKDAARDFVNALDFTGGVRKVGVLVFSVDARIAISLSNNKASVVNAINAIAQRGGGTNITDAVREARGMVTGASSQAGADKVLLLITDGVANAETGTLSGQVAAFKALPGEIFALGFGSASLAELNSIASDPDSSHVYISPSAAALAGIATDIAETIQNPAATNVVLNAVVGTPFSPVTGSSNATVGTTTAIPGGFRWSVATLGTETRTLTFQVQHSGNADGPFAALTSLSGTFVNSDGVSQPISATSPTVTITGCNDAPTADAGPDQTIALSGSPIADVALDGSASFDPDPQDTLTYSWATAAGDIVSGPSPHMNLGLGVHTLTLTVSDGRLSDTDEVTITVVDPTPPSVTSHVAGTLGNNGWYTSNIGISWTVVDNESPVTMTGCGPSSVTSDTAGVSFTCSASSAGGTASDTASVKRDATAPGVAYSGNHPSYSLTDTIAITCAASDGMSGLASSSCVGISGPATSFLGLNTFTATAVDRAGNSASTTITFTVAATVASLCELVERYVDQHGVAHSLCVKLEHHTIPPFVNEVNAQRGKRLTNAEADLLILLARTL